MRLVQEPIRVPLVINIIIGVEYSLGWAEIRAYHDGVRTLPVSKVKDRLNELVDEASSTRERVTITKNGSPAAVLVGAEDWESLQETLFWLSQPGIRDDVGQARREYEAGETLGEAEVRARLNLPGRG